jgi:2-polyprenyl-3-methyl-5-hydroxy-6-metoxy-1,4-benzoquinol methylase
MARSIRFIYGFADMIPANVIVRQALNDDHAGYSLADKAMREALSIAEERHFWQLSRNRFISTRLARLAIRPADHFLELGCGSGCVSAHLARMGYAVTGVDGHLALVLEAAARAPTAQFVVQDLASDRGLDVAGDGFDAAGFFDVIEHLDNPRDAIARGLGYVRPGGLVVGTVPALMALWSDADRRSGHRLRYSRSSLSELLTSVTGAHVVEVVPFNRLLIPFLWLHRHFADASNDTTGERYYRVPSPPLNALLYGLLRLEHMSLGWLPPADLLPGASLWFAIRKDVRAGSRVSPNGLSRSTPVSL